MKDRLALGIVEEAPRLLGDGVGNGRNAPMFVGRPEAAAAELAPWHETFRGGSDSTSRART